MSTPIRAGLRATRGLAAHAIACCVMLLCPIMSTAFTQAAVSRAGGEHGFGSYARQARQTRLIQTAVCSPREPFTPPVVATLPSSGSLALDQRRGIAIVVSSTSDAHATTLAAAEYDAMTGKPIRTRRIRSASILHAARLNLVSDSISVVVDPTTERIFVLHAPSGSGIYPAGRIDVLDERTLALLHSASVGSIPLTPALDERSGRVFVANQQSGTITVLDARDGHILHTTIVARGALGPSAPPVVDERSGHVFFAGNTAQGSVVMLDAHSGTVVHRSSVVSFPQAMALDRGNGHVLVAGRGGLVVLDTRGGRVLHSTALLGSPTVLLVDELAHRAFVSYADSLNVSMFDTATGALLRTVPVRLDNEPPGRPLLIDQAESQSYPILDRVDEQRRWVVVRVPRVVDDDGTEETVAQITVLDSRTATRIHTVFSQQSWPDAIAVDDRRGRAFSDVGGVITLYDISCLTSYYIFGDLG